MLTLKEAVVACLVACLMLQGAVAAPTTTGSLASVQQTYMQAQINMTSVSKVKTWANSLSASGSWPDIDYTSGCPARRASWPAISHWSRLSAMAISWYTQPQNNTALYGKIQSAMNYWFSNDYSSDDCIAEGGLANSTCPCGTPGLWNTNWYDQVIGVPKPASVACVFAQQGLNANQTAGCTRIMSRSWSQIDKFVYGIGYLTGANTLDVSSVGLALALFTNNQTLMADVFAHANGQVMIEPNPNDGIKADGSFFQHDGVLYTGNYGMVFMNDFLLFAAEAAGTPFEATDAQKAIFANLLEGTEWMSFYDSVNGTLRWEYSCLGRMVSMSSYSPFDVNIQQYPNATSTWSEYPQISASEQRLRSTGNTANPGKLNGNRMFWNADYMIMRRDNYIISLKMFSSRIRNNECVNLQNIKGYHLSDGFVYTYLSGNEYVDIFPTWDWYLLPGITVAYGADPLTCSLASTFGLDSFVGGVSDGSIGVAAMMYSDPLGHGATTWNKAWFFFDNQYVVLGNNISTQTASPLYSVLDQRKLNGNVYTSANTDMPTTTNTTTNYTNPAWLWHDNLGYVFLDQSAPTLSVSPSQQSGNWSSIAIDTNVVTTNVFKSWITHSNSSGNSLAYISAVDVNYSTFQKQVPLLKALIQVVSNTPQLSAVFHNTELTLDTVFWQAGTLSIPQHLSLSNYLGSHGSLFSLSVNAPAIVMVKLDIHNRQVNVHVSDPTQTQGDITLTLSNALLKCPKTASTGFSCQQKQNQVTLTVTLPTDNDAGSTIFRPSRWIPLIMCSWGTIVMLMSVATTYAGLLVCRLITGCIESGMYPGILYYLSFWYTRREMGKRVGAIVCAVTAAGAVGGLLATGIQYMDGALGHHAWQWIFILEGIPSILMGIIVFFFLPDFPGSKNSRRYFTEEEGAWLVSRLKDDHTDASDQKIHWKELTRGLIDYKIWLYTLIFFCQSCPVYSLAFFLPTIIQDMYISTSIAGNQGLTVPVYMFGLLMVILFSWSSDRFKDRLYHNFVSEIICIVGFIILLSVKSAGVLYFATMLTTLCFASAPTLIAWNNDNSLGTTRSALAIGLVVVGGNLSGVLASQMYKDAPYYFQSHLVNFCLQILSVILVLVLRFALKRENRKVDAMGVEARGSAYGEFRYTL
ncbi:hypothetical protein BZG36_03918 [Bifiguratus adelaidae]|uniref:Major facilitator superfamily (MFS) profile domain-containing protein n=1 Tax=Bifiguratus adelaidae TaxID=1938954 RepID=A0A261XZ58_9FUNG|nr:hypothetical protein BZG36_03918 [Bifiguratus adelaidae]